MCGSNGREKGNTRNTSGGDGSGKGEDVQKLLVNEEIGTMIKKYEGVIRTEAEIMALGCEIENEVIGDVSVKYAGHFGCVTLEIMNEHGDVKLFADHSLTNNVGKCVQFLVEFLECYEDRTVALNELFKGRPIRVVFKNTNRGKEYFGFGNYKKDRFFLWCELAPVMNLKND